MINVEKISDRFSPVIVKEVRMGLKSLMYPMIMVLAHVVFLLVTLGQLSAGLNAAGFDISTYYHYSPNFGSGYFFWLVFGGILLLFFPITALNSVENERKAQTIDIVLLTNLNSMRLIRGKWLASVCQILLLVVSFLPYLALRYFLSGVDFIQEILIFSSLILTSVFLTAVGLAVSCFHNKVLRAFFGLSLLWLPFSYAALFSMGYDTMSLGLQLFMLGLMVFYTLLYSWVFLYTGANFIAAKAENYTSRTRSFLLIATITALIFWFFSTGSTIDGAVLLVLFNLGALITVCMVSSNIWIPTLYKPLASKGPIGRVMGRLGFYPGWAGGFPLACLGVVIACLIMSSRGSFPARGLFLFAPAFMVTAIHILLRKKNVTIPKAFIIYIIVFLISTFTFPLLDTFDLWHGGENSIVAFFIPTFVAFEDSPVAWETEDIIALCSSTLAVLVCFVAWIKEQSQISKMEYYVKNGEKLTEEEKELPDAGTTES